MEGSIVNGIVSPIPCPVETSHPEISLWSGYYFDSAIFDCISVLSSFPTTWCILDLNPVMLFSYMVDIYLNITNFKIQWPDILITQTMFK